MEENRNLHCSLTIKDIDAHFKYSIHAKLKFQHFLCRIINFHANRLCWYAANINQKQHSYVTLCTYWIRSNNSHIKAKALKIYHFYDNDRYLLYNNSVATFSIISFDRRLALFIYKSRCLIFLKFSFFNFKFQFFLFMTEKCFNLITGFSFPIRSLNQLKK